MANKNIYEILGENIRYLRKKKHLTIEELSFLSNINRNYLNDIELAKKNPTVEILTRLALVFNVEPYYLLKERGTIYVRKSNK